MENEVIERTCRMNGLPLAGLSVLATEQDTELTREQMVKKILACEEFKMRKYLKTVQREQAKRTKEVQNAEEDMGADIARENVEMVPEETAVTIDEETIGKLALVW